MLLTKERLDNMREGAKLVTHNALAPSFRMLLSHIDTLKSDSIPKAKVVQILQRFINTQPKGVVLNLQTVQRNATVKLIMKEINNYKEGSEG